MRLAIDNVFQIAMNVFGSKFDESGTIAIAHMFKSNIFYPSYERQKYGFVGECWKWITETELVFARYLELKCVDHTKCGEKN